jgi:hypothetical protein
MGIFNKTPKVSIEDYCQQFYDNYIFNQTGDGFSDFLGEIEDRALRLVLEVDQSFSSVNQGLFYNEMLALVLELFGIAWFQKFIKDKLTIPQSVFTKLYLTGKEKLDIWDIMGAYNHVIAYSSGLNSSGEQMDGRVARGKNTYFNALKMETFKEWVQKDIDPDCIARVTNRFGADIKRGDSISTRLLAVSLAKRLQCNASPNDLGLSMLSGNIHGLYVGVTGWIKNVRLQS